MLPGELQRIVDIVDFGFVRLIYLSMILGNCRNENMWGFCLFKGHTSGIAYTKLPIGFIVEPLSPGVVVERKTIVDVFIGVKWIWTVVCGVFGSGKDNSMACRDGSAGSDKGGGWFDNAVAILEGRIFC